MNWSAIAAVILALAVGLGAFGAHGLRDRLDEYRMGVWEKAVSITSSTRWACWPFR